LIGKVKGIRILNEENSDKTRNELEIASIITKSDGSDEIWLNSVKFDGNLVKLLKDPGQKMKINKTEGLFKVLQNAEQSGKLVAVIEEMSKNGLRYLVQVGKGISSSDTPFFWELNQMECFDHFKVTRKLLVLLCSTSGEILVANWPTMAVPEVLLYKKGAGKSLAVIEENLVTTYEQSWRIYSTRIISGSLAWEIVSN
jgi:hypothetical protein